MHWAGGERTHVGIATFDSVVHFYNLRASQSQPQMLVVPDVDEVYSPMPAGLLVRSCPLHQACLLSIFIFRPVSLPELAL